MGANIYIIIYISDTPDGDRTHNLCFRRAALYPVELQKLILIIELILVTIIMHLIGIEPMTFALLEWRSTYWATGAMWGKKVTGSGFDPPTLGWRKKNMILSISVSNMSPTLCLWAILLWKMTHQKRFWRCQEKKKSKVLTCACFKKFWDIGSHSSFV